MHTPDYDDFNGEGNPIYYLNISRDDDLSIEIVIAVRGQEGLSMTKGESDMVLRVFINGNVIVNVPEELSYSFLSTD